MRAAILAGLFLMCDGALGQPTRVPADNTTLSLGAGFDTITGSQRRSCVEFKKPAPSHSEKQKSDFKATRAVSEEDYISSANYRVSATLKIGIFGGDGSVDYMRTAHSSRYSENLVLRHNVENAAEVITPISFTKDAKPLRGNPVKFREVCGDTFVIGRVLGGQLAITYAFKSQTEQAQERLRSRLDVAIGAFNQSSGQATTDLQSLIKQNTSAYTVLRTGPREAIPPMDPEKLFEYARHFNNSIKPGSEWTVEYLLADYLQVPDGHPTPPSDAWTYLTQMDAMARRLMKRMAGLRYISENRNEFGLFSAARLEAELTTLGNDLDALRTAAAACAAKKACKLPKITEPELLPPRARDYVDINPASAGEILVAEIGSGDSLVFQLRGGWYCHCSSAERCRIKPGQSDTLRVYNPRTKQETAFQPVNPVYITGPAFAYYRVNDSAYVDNCAASEGFQWRTFVPLYREDVAIPMRVLWTKPEPSVRVSK